MAMIWMDARIVANFALLLTSSGLSLPSYSLVSHLASLISLQDPVNCVKGQPKGQAMPTSCLSAYNDGSAFALFQASSSPDGQLCSALQALPEPQKLLCQDQSWTATGIEDELIQAPI